MADIWDAGQYLRFGGERSRPFFDLIAQVANREFALIFITAHADEASRQRALKGGAIEFLSKPVRREPLFKAIQSAIES